MDTWLGVGNAVLLSVPLFMGWFQEFLIVVFINLGIIVPSITYGYLKILEPLKDFKMSLIISFFILPVILFFTLGLLGVLSMLDYKELIFYKWING